MKISVQNRLYDLPHSLMLCPACRRADLEWDGRGAWRCTSMRVAVDGSRKRGCRHGITLAAIFEDNDLEMRFSTSQVRLGSLALTAYGRELLRAGAIRFPWMTARMLWRHIVERREDQSEETAQLEQLMRQAPGPTRSIKARKPRSVCLERGEEL